MQVQSGNMDFSAVVGYSLRQPGRRVGAFNQSNSGTGRLLSVECSVQRVFSAGNQAGRILAVLRGFLPGRKLAAVLVASSCVLLAACQDKSGAGAGPVGKGSVASSQEASGSSSVPVAAAAPAWYVFNGNELPGSATAIVTPEGTSLAFNNISNDGAHLSLDGKGSLRIDTASDASPAYAKVTLPHPQAYPCSMTLLARVTGNSAGYRAADLEIALSPDGATAGSRVKTIIGSGGTKGVQVEKFDGDHSIDEAFDASGTHIYQVTLTLTTPNQGSFAVYVDGAPKPVLSQNNVSLRATGKPGDNYIGFGANSNSMPYQSSIDWLVWTSSGAFSPEQLRGRLPAVLGQAGGA